MVVCKIIITNVYHVKFRENYTNVDTNYERVSNFVSRGIENRNHK